MPSNRSSQQEFIGFSASEIDQITDGRYSDDDILVAAHKLSENEDQSQARAKKMALWKLIWRSPEIDEWYAYEEILPDLLGEIIDQEHGQNYLYWALLQAAYFARPDWGLFRFNVYWDYARGLLYEGRGYIFARFLRLLLGKTALPDYALRQLIEDTARLGAANLSNKLQTLAKERYPDGWRSVLIDDLMSQREDPEAPSILNEALQQTIFDRLSLQAFADPDAEVEMGPLFTSEETYKKITENFETEDALLLVPDFLQVLFRNWEDDPKNFLRFRKLLTIIKSFLPELSCLGDIVDPELDDVLIFKGFGKTRGFSFQSVQAYAIHPEFAIELRIDATRAIMQIPSIAPHLRSQVIDVIKELLISQEADPTEDDQLTSFIVADLLDTDLFELKPAVAQVFREDRVDPQVVGLNSYAGQWALTGVPPTTSHTKTILLTCQQCGRTRKHPYNVVFYDINMRSRTPNFTPFEFFFDHPISCPKCGAKDTYTVALPSMLRLIPPNFFNEDEDSAPLLDEAVYLVFSERLFMDGLSPFLFSNLRKKVIDGGVDSLDPLECGEYLRVTGRFQESLDALRQYQSKNPQSQPGTLATAMAEHDYGDRNQAGEHYQRVLAMEKGKRTSQVDSPRYQAALQGLQFLEQGKISPFLYPMNKFRKTLLDHTSEKISKRKRR